MSDDKISPRDAEQLAACFTADARGRAVAGLYRIHYRPLVKLAVLLGHDIATAEDIVQDAFVALHAAWPRVADRGRVVSYLRQSVVIRSRSVLRHRAAAAGHAPLSALDSALRALPSRQREVLVLRYYAGLSEAQIAAVMGISKRAVKSYTARALSSLQGELPKTEE